MIVMGFRTRRYNRTDVGFGPLIFATPSLNGLTAGYLNGKTNHWFANAAAASAIATQEMFPPTGGTLKLIQIRYTAVAAQAVTYVVEVNGVPTAMTVLYPAASTAIIELATDVIIPAGASTVIEVSFTAPANPGTAQQVTAYLWGLWNL